MEPALWRVLAQIRKKGHSVDRKENEPGVRWPAVRARDTVRHALGALGIAGPSVRIADETISEHGIQVFETAHAISESLRAP